MKKLKATWRVIWLGVFLACIHLAAIPLVIGMGFTFTHKWLHKNLDALMELTK